MQLLTTLMLFLVFLGLALVTYYPLGYWVISKSKTKLQEQEILTLSFLITIVVSVVYSLLLGLLGLRFLLLPTIFVVFILTLKRFGYKLFLPWKLFLDNKILLLLVVIAILVQGFINFPSGYLYGGDLLFWSSQGHDGLWHVALIEEMRKSLPLRNPLIANEMLYNYHYLMDVVMGEFARIFPFFSSLDLYFRYFPVLLSFLISISVYSLVTRWKGKKEVGYLAIFFTAFVGSFGYIVTYLKTGNVFGGETMFWASQNNTILGNPPHASGFALMSGFFLGYYFYLKKRNRYWLSITLLIAAFLAGFKVSAGLVVLIGLGVGMLIDFYHKRDKSIVVLTTALGASNFITVKLMTKGVESFLIFEPWWFVRTMVVVRLDWIDLELRRQHYVSVNTWKGWLRVIQLEGMAFLIFLFGNLGARIIGFYELVRRPVMEFNKLIGDTLEVSLITTMLASFAIPMLFIQKGISFNNIQFVQYFLLIFGFYAAISTYKIIKMTNSKVVKTLVVVILVMLGTPTVIGNFVEFYGPGRSPLAKVTSREIDALNYLKDNSDEESLVLSVPFDQYFKTNFEGLPLPIYAWYSTAYIPALASRRTYLSSEEQVDITGYDKGEYVEKMNKYFSQNDIAWNKRFLAENGIDYVYIAKDEQVEPINLDANGLGVFFENEKVIIYDVN